jgi:hypothetical protein
MICVPSLSLILRNRVSPEGKIADWEVAPVLNLLPGAPECECPAVGRTLSADYARPQGPVANGRQVRPRPKGE